MLQTIQKIIKLSWCLPLLWILATPAWSDSSDSSSVIQPIPETGAFSASFREDRGAITIIDFAGNYDKEIDGLPNHEPRAVVAREFLRTHTDEYDFLVVFSTFEFETGEAIAFHRRIQNKVQGIGLDRYDNSASFGSAGHLLGYTDMAALSRYVTNPLDPEFERVLSVLGHEILHQWSGNVRFDQGMGPETALIGRDGAHWSNLLDSEASLLYGHKWHDNGDSTFTSVASFKFLSPLDLYLAGFYGAHEVPPMTLIVNSKIDHQLIPSESLAQYGPTISGTARHVSIDDIITAEGPRLPSVAESKKHFRFGFILLAGANETVSQSQLSAIDRVRRGFVDRFSVWTGGRATANAYPQGVGSAQAGMPDVVVGGEPRVDSANVSQAFTWLRTQQNPDGFWRDKETTTLRDTVVVTDILAHFDASFQHEADALDWVSKLENANTDYQARQAGLLQDLGRNSQAETIRGRLLEQQNLDGGWGISSTFASNSLDTALAVQTLHGQANFTNDALSRAVEYLHAQQNADGGWGNRVGSPSRTSVTTTVLQALRKVGQVESVSESAVTFLVGKQNSDGGFGDSPSTVHDTSNVLLTLTDLEALDQIRNEDALNYLLIRQSENGDWAGSTYATALAALALQRLSIGNWVLSLRDMEPSIPRDGDKVLLTFSVSNDTNQAMPSTVLRVLDGNAQIGTDLNLPALATGQSTDISLYWDSYGLVGEHNINAIVDPDSVVLETSERDNRVTTNVTVTGASSGVDFSITQSDVAVMPANPSLLPTTLGFAVAVRNLGLSDTSDVRVQLRADTKDGAILDEQLFNIPGRGSIAANFSYELLDPGTKRFVIVVDGDDQYKETRENNNIVVVQLGTENTLDLVVNDTDISANVSSAIIGEDITFNITLRNRGTLDTPSVAVRYLISDGTRTTELATNVVQIDAGGTSTSNITWRVDREGALTFSVQIDPDNLLPELFEDNNSASFGFTGGQANGPNLVVSHADFSFDPQPGLEARSLLLSALVRNTGNLTANNIEVAFYDGDPDKDGVLIETLQSVSTLDPGESATVNVTWSAVPDAQDKLMFVVADPNNTVEEYSETDNQAFNVLEVLSLADLALSSEDITLSPAFPANGDKVDVSVLVANLGQQSAANTVVRIFDNDPGFGGRQIGDDLNLDLDGNDSGVVNFSFTLPSDGVAIQTLYVQIDPEDQILEQTELNNSAVKEFTVQDADFVVSQHFISPNGDDVQDATEFIFRLQQTSDVEIVVIDEHDRIIRRYSGNEWSAVEGGRLTWDGLDEYGRVVADGRYRFQVQDVDGPVFGSVSVTVDNNRSPLLRAVGTEYDSYTNLTCKIENLNSVSYARDDSGMVFLISYDSAEFSSGVYRMDGNGTNIQSLYSKSDFGASGNYDGPRSVIGNTDLSLLYSVVFVNSQRQHWISDGQGENLWQLSVATGAEFIGFGPDDQSVIMMTDDKLAVVPVTGEEPAVLADFTGMTVLSSEMSPDQNRVLLDISDTTSRSRRLVLIDIPGQTTTDLLQQTVPPNSYLNDTDFWPFSWSPDGSRFAVVNSQTWDVSIFAQSGQILNTISWADIVTVANVSTLSKPQWSTVSDELAFALVFSVDSNDGADSDQGGLFLVNMQAETVKRVYDFPLKQGSSGGDLGFSIENLIDVIIPSALAQDTNTFMPSSNFTGFLWVPNERTLLLQAQEFNTISYYSNDYPVAAFFLDGDNHEPQRIFSVFYNVESRWNYEAAKSGHQLFYNSTRESKDPNSTCVGNTDIWAFRSLLNLTADLRAIRSDRVGGILLNGTASDANFKQYRLEYAYADNADLWRPIQPASGQSVIDGKFAVWIPPAPGSYFVRLIVSDLAGNRRQKIKRVSWSETPAITDLFRVPELFSPNGDGIADFSNIQYRTLTPVHLEFSFYDAAGNLVRHIIRDHSEVGQTFQFNWDGRNDDGLLLPDGEYRMTVQNYEFFFHIDSNFPEVFFFLDDAYQAIELLDSSGEPRGKFAVANPQVNWSVFDPNYSDSSIEWASMSNSATWHLFEDPDPARKNAEGKVEGNKSLELSTSDGYRDEVTNRSYRMIAEDGAGNRTVVNLPPVAEQLMVVGFGGHKPNQSLDFSTYQTEVDNPTLTENLKKIGGLFDLLEDIPYAEMSNSDGVAPALVLAKGEMRFHVKETIFNRLSSLEVEYRLLNETEWSSSTLGRYFDEAQLFAHTPTERTSVSDMDIDYHAIWIPPADMDSNMDYAVRLKGTEADGQTHLSNAFRVRFSESISFEGLRRNATMEDQSLINQVLGTPALSNEYVLWGKVASANPVSSIQVFISSSDDPRYAAEREIGEFYNAVNAYAVKTQDLNSCHKYSVRVVGLTEAREDPQSGDLIPGNRKEITGDFTLPCLTLDVEVKPVIAADCNLPPTQALHIGFSPRSIDGVPLQMLSLSTEDSQDVLFNINEPTSAPRSVPDPVFNYEYTLDTSNMAPGERVFQARLLNINNEVVTVNVPLSIDHTAPQAGISFPAEGIKVCGVPRSVSIDGEAEIFNVMGLEGVIQDDNPVGYFLDFNPGSEYNAATAKRFHDSNPEEGLDSFQAARAVKPVRFNSSQASRNINTIKPDFSNRRKAGTLGELYNITGENNVRLHVYDWGGHHVCTDRAFTFDGDVQLTSTGVDHKLFSPNADGIDDSVEISYVLEENARLDVEIFAATVDAKKGAHIIGNSLRTVVSDSQVFAGNGQLDWDGRDSAGATLADGLYGIRLSFTDSCGNTRRAVQFVELDNTAPALDVLFPQLGSQLPLMTEVQGTVTDKNFEAYQVEVGSGSDPETWLQINAGKRAITTPQVLGVWNTFGLQGDYTLRISAGDRVGNRTELLIPLTLTEPLNMISYVEAVDALFSPNGDGRRESTSIRFGLEQEVIASLSIMKGSQVVRELLVDKRFGSGPQSVRWDGQNSAGVMVSDGVYKVRLSTVLASNNLVNQTEEITVTVDASLPTVEIIQPDKGFIRSGSPLVGTISDVHLQSYSISIANTSANSSWEEIASGNLNKVNASLTVLSAELEGNYSLRITAEDLAENWAEQIIQFSIDNTSPQVSLSAPLNNAYASSQTSLVISGDAIEDNPASYLLEYSAAGSNIRNVIVNGVDFPLPNVLAQWDIAAVNDGVYDLRFSVKDRAGNIGVVNQVLTVDNTPPVAVITTPQEDGYLTIGTHLKGVASDLNLKEYRLEIASGNPATAEQYSLLNTGTTSINDDNLLEISVLPQDGQYSLRLQVDDLAGNRSQVLLPVIVDTTPPQQPADLVAEIENESNIRLNWNANTEADLAGYLVYRNGQQITSEPIVNPEYLDVTVSQGNHIYTIKAVDHAGNKSEDSLPADMVIDLVAPGVSISAPVGGSKVSGLVDIRGTAYSQGDFKEYRLYIARADSPDVRQLLRRSPVPRQAESLGEWNTIALPEGVEYVISLEGEDLNGNTAINEVTVSVDNLAPSQPTGLTINANGANASLSWNPNTEADLMGYLVFRNDRIANATGTVVGDLRPYAILTSDYKDLALPDGDYSYTIVAIDDAGNQSYASQAAEVTIDTRAPQASIIQPADGIEFEKPIYVLATSEDNDISTVQFQYRVSGDTTWIDFEADTELPFDVDFDPVALGLVIGDYELRAVATDHGNRVDASPQFITVKYRDLTAPKQVLDLQAHVNGGEVSLSWSANSETDFVGYHIDRVDNEGVTTRLTTTVLSANSYVDANLADGEYRYRVIALDDSGNESVVSDEVVAVVYTPQFEPYLVPTTLAELNLNGQGVTQATVNATLTNSLGTVNFDPFDTDASGLFLLHVLLEPGTNELAVHLTDLNGNVSKVVDLNIVRGEGPGRPTGLTGSANGYEVSLSWNPNPESDIAGYSLYRNGVKVQEDLAVTGLSATTSGFLYSAVGANAIDGNIYSSWRPPYPSGNQWIELDWDQPQLITQVILNWEYWYGVPTSYDIEAFFQGEWVLLEQIRNASDQLEHKVVLQAPYMTTKIRMVIRSDDDYVYLSEITPMYSPLIDGTSFVDTAPNGIQEYTVTAVSTLGFESEPSVPAEQSVGDVTPPEAVTLNAIADGSDVDLSWTESAATDIASYDIYRDGMLIEHITDIGILTYRDLGLLNGSHSYQVVVLDQVGNQSAPSNESIVTIDNAETFNLIVNSDAAGSVLQLNWNAATDISPNKYRIFRAETEGGIYTEIGRVDGGVQNYNDTNLQNEIARYYVVIAVNDVSEQTAVSNVASGIPLDTLAPITPVIHTPVKSGELYFTTEARATISGTTEAAVTVDLIVDGQKIQQTSSLTEPEVFNTNIYTSNFNSNSNPNLSPDGQLLVYKSENYYMPRLLLFDFATNEERLVYESTLSNSAGLDSQWFSDGERILFVEDTGWKYSLSYGVVRIYSLKDGSIIDVTDLNNSNISQATPSPDGTQIAMVGRFYDTDKTGLWLFDLATREKTLLREGSENQFSLPQWSPNGKQIAYLNQVASPETVEIYQLDTGSIITTGESAAADRPVRWSPDSNSLVYQRYDSVLRYNVISSYSIEDDTIEVLVSDPTVRPRTPQWSPDGQQIAYIESNSRQLRVRDIDTGVENILLEGGYFESLDQWISSGHLLVNWEYYFQRITPPGYFEFKDVNLKPGDNEVAAVATDAAGNISAMSDSIVIQRGLGNLADLSVRPEDIVLLPSIPNVNETVSVGITVRNLGLSSSEPASFSVMAIDPMGQSVQLVVPSLISGLVPGASQTLSASWPVGSEPGEYTLVVFVDQENAVYELNEANNTLIMSQPVTEVSGLIATIDMDAAEYKSTQTANITLEISNGGNAFDGRFEVSIEDGQGVNVAKIDSEAIQGLVFADSISRTLEWNTSSTFAGVYRAVIRVWDAEDILVSNEATDFSINTSLQVEANVVTDRSRYSGNSNVRVSGTVNYTAGNVVLDGASASLRIIDDSGQVLKEAIKPLADMIPGGNSSISMDWNTGTQSAGLYYVKLQVMQNSDAITQVQSAFEIESISMQISGALTLTEQSLAAGAIQQVGFSINNAGNTAVSQLPVIVSLFDPNTLTVLQNQTLLVDIDANNFTTGSFNFATANLRLGVYKLLLQAEVPDANGLISLLNLDTANFNLQDRIPPTVNMLQPLNGGFINTTDEVRYIAQDVLTAVSQSAFQIDDGAWMTAVIRDASNSIYGATLPALSETQHTLRARATDTAGNTGFSESISFTVDNTAPSISVDGVSDGVYYSGSVVPVITVTDANVSDIYIGLNGETYVSGTPISEDGQYVLFVDVTDLAGNITQATLSFVIDNNSPLIEISGVVDGHLFNTSVLPEISISDENLATSTVTLNAESFIPGTTIVEEGEYLLQVNATDLAGNISTQQLEFRIDLTPPILVVSEPQDGMVIDTTIIDIIGQTEPAAVVQLVTDTYQTSVMADGLGQFVFNAVELLEGENLFTLSVTDLAGNIGEQLELTVLRVPAQQIKLNGSLTVKPRVLAWIPDSGHCDGQGEHDHCQGEHNHGQGEHDQCQGEHDHRQSEHDHKQSEDDNCHAGHGQPAGADLEPLAQMLDEMFSENKIDYKLAQNAADFRQALSSQLYNVVLVADVRPDNNGFCRDDEHRKSWFDYLSHHKDGDNDNCRTLKDQLKLGVAGGNGLVMISTQPDHSNELLDIMGASYHARDHHHTHSQVSLIDSPLGTATVLDIQGQGVALKNKGGMTVAIHLPGNKPALVINNYRAGKTALVGFNPSDLADIEQAKKLLSRLFAFAAPQTLELHPGSVIDLQWTVSEVDPPLDVTLKQFSYQGIGLLHAYDGEITDAQTMFWQRLIEGEQDVFSAVIRLPFDKGEFPINADLMKNDSVLSSLQLSELLITTDQDRHDLAAALLVEMQSIELRKRKDKYRLNKAIRLVQAAIDTPLDTRKAIDSALKSLVKAYEELEEMKTDLPDIQARIGLLYRLYQLEWYQLTTTDRQ